MARTAHAHAHAVFLGALIFPWSRGGGSPVIRQVRLTYGILALVAPYLRVVLAGEGGTTPTSLRLVR